MHLALEIFRITSKIEADRVGAADILLVQVAVLFLLSDCGVTLVF